MLKTYWRLVSRIERVADNVIVVSAFFLAYELRDIVLFISERLLPFLGELRMLGPRESYFVVLAFALFFFNWALSLLGGYRSMRLSSGGYVLRMTFFSSVLVFFSLSAMLFILKLDLSRSFVGLFCFFAGVLLFIERYAVLTLLRVMRLRGRNFRNVLIVGTGEQAVRLYQEISQHPELGIRIVGFADISAEVEALGQVAHSDLVGHPWASATLPLRIVATADSFERSLKRYAIDEVLFTDVSRSFPVVEDLARIASEEGIGVSLVADLFSLEILRSGTSHFGSIPLIHYRSAPSEGMALVAKRLLDIVISASLLVVLSPLMVATAVAIKLDSPGPIFFRQRRVGLNGRMFTLLKFRSMVKGARRMLPALRAKNEMIGPVFKLRNDPRVTRFGRFLRRFSVDELPQLFNVLKGDMSLVGPRPPLPEEVSHYVRKQRRRLSMRPGLTCTWQVSGRNNIPDFEEWARMDLEYIDNWSLVTDIKLLLRTIPAVLSGSGAE